MLREPTESFLDYERNRQYKNGEYIYLIVDKRGKRITSDCSFARAFDKFKSDQDASKMYMLTKDLYPKKTLALWK